MPLFALVRYACKNLLIPPLFVAIVREGRVTAE